VTCPAACEITIRQAHPGNGPVSGLSDQYMAGPSDGLEFSRDAPADCASKNDSRTGNLEESWAK